MYDPTIFENLKVAFENHVYDLDNLERRIHILNRADRMDFAVMDREFAIRFSLTTQRKVTVEVVLSASLDDLAGEILDVPGKNLGCTLLLRFYMDVDNVSVQCEKIENVLKTMWEDDTELTQNLSFDYKQQDNSYLNTIELKFLHKLDEENMGELSEFLENVLNSLEKLNGL